MRKFILSLCLLAAGTSALAGADYKCFENLRYGPARSDVPAGDPTQDRILDIRLPEGEAPAKGWPTVVFIHGGGFSGGDKAMGKGVKPLFEGMLAKGYAVVSINYCLTRKNDKANRPKDFKGRWVSCSSEMKNGFPADGKYHPDLQRAIDDASEDAGMALVWLSKNARKYGLDKKRFAIMGGSAGAITCLYTAFVYPPKKVKIRAVVNCWGAIHDVAAIKTAKIPVLTFHGETDELINVCYGGAIQKRLEELASKDSRFIYMEGRGHAQYLYVGKQRIGDVTDFLDKVL